jgi:hypothetical protein
MINGWKQAIVERDEARHNLELCMAANSDVARIARERDEALATLTDIHRWIERNHPDGFIDSMTYHQNLERVGDRWYDRFDIAERERDEARKHLRDANRGAEINAHINQKYAQQIIDARDENAKLRDIAERAIDYLDQSYRNGFEDEANELRAELEQIKEGGK